MPPLPNTSAPDFSLPDENGKIHTLSDYRGRWVLIYFYPKDDTSGCTREACVIRDRFTEFEQHNAVVLGISKDPVKHHGKFKTKYRLPFTLLSDETKEVQQLYGVWQKKKFMGREYMGTLRNSFLIDPQGNIAKVYEKVKPEEHAGEVLEDLAHLGTK